jgi:hypothetical protein
VVARDRTTLQYITVKCPGWITVVIRGSSDAAVYSSLVKIKRANRRYNRMKNADEFVAGDGQIESLIARRLPPSFISRAFRQFDLFTKARVMVLDDSSSKLFMIKSAFTTLEQLFAVCYS